MIRLIIVGFTGKMGQAIYSAIQQKSTELCAVAGVDISKCENAPIPIYNSIDEVKEEADGIIDFSRPEAIYSTLPYCAKHGMFAVIGTTALSDDDRAFMDSYALTIPIFTSGNMSIGVNLQMQLVKNAAQTLGLAFEPEIVEKHHHLKVDAPSGTALMLADSICSQYNEDIQRKYGRYTKTERRKRNEIGIHSVRGGTIVGEHECYFIGTDEVLEINHRAYSKQIFAQGACRAAVFMKNMLPGIYSMQDIVNETNPHSRLYATDNYAVIMVKGLGKNALSTVFGALADEDIFIDMISVAAFGEVSLTVKSAQLYDTVTCLEKLSGKIPEIQIYDLDDITKITVEGLNMDTSSGVASQVFEVLESSGIDPILVTTSETKISIAVENQYAQSALKALSDNLDL